jgi:calcium-dependent protein kinase
VYLATNLDTKSTVAIKKVKKSKIAENEVYYDLMESELKILLDTDHPHITRVFEVCENKNNFFIVMELMDGGSLWNRIEKIKHFSEDHVASIVH